MSVKEYFLTPSLYCPSTLLIQVYFSDGMTQGYRGQCEATQVYFPGLVCWDNSCNSPSVYLGLTPKNLTTLY